MSEATRKLRDWAATQPQDNFVQQLACGHDIDTPEELPEHQLVRCPVHGDTEIVYPKDLSMFEHRNPIPPAS